jgi:hypothetical protein
MPQRLPWIISCAVSTLLTLSISEQSNSYQASIDTAIYQQTGDLKVAWMKPEGALANLLTFSSGGMACFALYQILNQSTTVQTETKKESKKSQKAEAESEEQPLKEPLESEQEHEDGDDASESPETVVALVSVPEKPSLFDRVWNHRKRHLLIPAETGAGKTTLLLGLLKYFWEQSGETVEIYASTVKPSPCLGLEFETAPDGLPKVINLNVTDPATVETLIHRLRWLQKRLQKRQNQRAEAEAANKPYTPTRIIIVADEWNSTLGLAARFDKILAREFSIAKAEKAEVLPQPPYAVDELKSLMESILLMGREDECAEWVFGQDHQVQNAGFNTGYRKSFGVLVPFRKGATQSLEDALIGRSPVLPFQIGKQILEQANKEIEANPDGAFVYSNLNGHEILEVPYMPNIKREKLNGKQQPATAGQSESATEPTAELSESDPW